jgi:hypothetical protein
MPWGVAAAAVGVAGSIYSSKKSSKAAEEAGEREGAASEAAIERQEEAYGEAKSALAPYARQEAAYSSQLAAQMGVAPIAGGAGDPWGYEPGGYAGGGMGAGGQAADDAMNSFLDQLIAEEMAIARRAGYKGKHGAKAVAQGARMATGAIKKLKAAGKLPADFKEPTMADWDTRGKEQMRVHGGYKALGRNVGDLTQSSGYGGYERFAEEFTTATALPEGGVQAGGPGGMMGQGQFIDPVTGEVTGGGGAPGGGPQVQTISSIMERAGADQLPPELREQYMADLAEDPRTDPELAEYLGLTQESMDVGDSYQDTPAYMAARTQGIEAVDAGAAAGGGLYSGRRGKALRDVGQDVEQQYFFNAQQQREQMMGARRGERTQGIARRGATYEAGQQREQSYYNNYMSMLSELSAPTTTSNIAAMGTSLGKETSANILGTARGQSDLAIGAAGAEGAAIADVTGGIMNMASSYLGPRK